MCMTQNSFGLFFSCNHLSLDVKYLQISLFKEKKKTHTKDTYQYRNKEIIERLCPKCISIPKIPILNTAEGRCVICLFFARLDFVTFCTYIANQTGSPKNQWIPKVSDIKNKTTSCTITNTQYGCKQKKRGDIHSACHYLYPKCVLFSFFRTIALMF